MNVEPKRGPENSFNPPSNDVSIKLNENVKYLALHKVQLTTDHLLEWHSLLAKTKHADADQIKSKLDSYVSKVNNDLKSLINNRDLKKLADLIGKRLYQFEQLHPFTTFNSQIAQAISSYMSLYYGIPMFQFKENEQKKYKESASASDKMVKLVSEKMRETVFDPFGNECYLQEFFSNAGRYYCPATGQFSTIEWHEFAR